MWMVERKDEGASNPCRRDSLAHNISQVLTADLEGFVAAQQGIQPTCKLRVAVRIL